MAKLIEAEAANRINCFPSIDLMWVVELCKISILKLLGSAIPPPSFFFSPNLSIPTGNGEGKWWGK
jgi:hypothetical protein